MADLMRMMPDAWPVFYYMRRPRPIQEKAMPEILKGKSVFLVSPTASGKTEAAVAPLYQRHISFKRDHLSVVYVAPTKALVNDLYYRLIDYLGSGKESSGICRYTGDHHDFNAPEGGFILIATPEALDSLQLTQPQKLEFVRAMVIDEVHFIHGHARGEQLRYVIDRIRGNSRPPSDKRDNFHVVAMSATLNDMGTVGRLWAGDQVEIISADDPREIEMDFLPIPDGKIKDNTGTIAQTIKAFVESSNLSKVLIFANSRNDAHQLSISLHETFQKMRWPVFLHLGILQQSERDRVEAELRSSRNFICVATSTLELGIDIGDIETVVLLSPPLSVSSFLQRIGRGNRRTGTCRVTVLPRNDLERVFFEALLALARQGILEPVHEYVRPSVAFQQVLSLAWHGLVKDNPLTENNISKRSGGHNFSAIVRDMLNEGHLRSIQEAIIPSEELTEIGDRRMIHSVIAGTGGHTIFDGVTGDAVANLGAGAEEGLFFLGGSLRRLVSSERNSYMLEQVAPGSSHQIGSIPTARGRHAISRTLVWKIADLTGKNPRSWNWDGNRLVTWGGWANNRLLNDLLSKHRLATPTGFDAFSLTGLSEREDITPESVLDLIQPFKLELSFKEAALFREPTRFYRYLGLPLKQQEAQGAVPLKEFMQWLRECCGIGTHVAAPKPVADKGTIPESETRSTLLPPARDIDIPPRIQPDVPTNKLTLALQWIDDGAPAASYVAGLTSYFYSGAHKVVLALEDGTTFDDLELGECIGILRERRQGHLQFFHSDTDSTRVFLTVRLIPSTQNGAAPDKITVSFPGTWQADALISHPHHLGWYQSDFDFPAPLPILALPFNGPTMHPAAMHALVALARTGGGFSSAELQVEFSQGQIETVARWHTHRPSDAGTLYPIVPLFGDSLWLATDNPGPQEPPLWLELLCVGDLSTPYPNLREHLEPLFGDGIPDPARIKAVLSERLSLELDVDIAPLAELPPLVSPAQKDTILALSPNSVSVALGIDVTQPPELMLEAVLHGIGHVLLGHVHPGDTSGHTDTAGSIHGQGTLRRWDREVRETFAAWFLPDLKRKVATLAECTPQEKAQLGLWRMMGEMLGESRRLHARAEQYQHAVYQRQAAQRLLAQLEEYGGAMLCDGVGLGKTYVATTLMVHYTNVWRDLHQEDPDMLLTDPFRITVLAPNSVVSTWQREAVPPLAAHGVPMATIRVVSHTKLSRITRASEVLEPPSRHRDLSDMEHLLLSDLVIVDEAHNFRSVSARRTVVLRDLLRLQPRKDQRRRVLLLTATPVNNTLDDLMQEAALLFSKPLWLSDAVTEDGYRRQAVKVVNERCTKARSPKGPRGDVAALLVHGQTDARFSIANDFRDDLDFGPNVQRIGEYLKEQNQRLQQLQQSVRAAADGHRTLPCSEPTRIAEELLDRIVVQRSRDLCKAIERQQGSDVELLFRADAGAPEKLHYHDEYDGMHDVLAGFLPLFDHGDSRSLEGHPPLSLKVYMWYDVSEGIKDPDEVSSVVGLQRILVLKRLESSPVSFLITLLRLTVLHAHRLQQLLKLCQQVGDKQRTATLTKELDRLLARSTDAALDKIRSLATGDMVTDPRHDFLKALGNAQAAKIPAAESDDAPRQLSLFEPDEEAALEAHDQLERLWGLKDYLLQDFDTLLQVTPGLADVVFGRFDRAQWPQKFTLGGDAVDWPTSAAWGLRVVTDAKLRALVARLIEARRQGQKVIVFSQFSDTLAYLYSVLQATRAFTQTDWRMVVPGLAVSGLKTVEITALIEETSMITGETEDRDEVVNAFAPFYRIGPFPPATDGACPGEQSTRFDTWTTAWSQALHKPIHVLLSSDVLAEGVNLQDAAALINYDVHWNPVRMIQRAGRIDRRLNPRIEHARTFPELETHARRIGAEVSRYYWHDRAGQAPLTINMILPDELEAELLLRERIALKTLAIDFTLGLDQGTGAEADWMQNYTYQGVSSLNAFQKDRAIEQVAGYYEKIGRIFKERGIAPEWASDLNTWFRARDAHSGSPLVGRAMMGRRDGNLERFTRYLEPIIHNGVPYWFWAEKKPGESIFDGWLIMDGRQENFPPHPTRDIPWSEKVAMPIKAAHLLGAAILLDKGIEVLELPRQEIGRPLMQGATALAAPKLGSEEDRVLITLRDFFILQLMDFEPERHGGSIS